MKSNLISYHIYDLSNPHFQHIEILTDKNETIRGQFVEFKVVKDNIEYLYPSEKFCFLPDEYKKVFWEAHKSNNGEFTDLPPFTKLFGLNVIKKIVILPVQVI